MAETFLGLSEGLGVGPVLLELGEERNAVDELGLGLGAEGLKAGGGEGREVPGEGEGEVAGLLVAVGEDASLRVHSEQGLLPDGLALHLLLQVLRERTQASEGQVYQAGHQRAFVLRQHCLGRQAHGVLLPPLHVVVLVLLRCLLEVLVRVPPKREQHLRSEEGRVPFVDASLGQLAKVHSPAFVHRLHQCVLQDCW